MLCLTSNQAKVRQKRQLCCYELIWFLNSMVPQACLPCLWLFSCLLLTCPKNINFNWTLSRQSLFSTQDNLLQLCFHPEAVFALLIIDLSIKEVVIKSQKIKKNILRKYISVFIFLSKSIYFHFSLNCFSKVLKIIWFCCGFLSFLVVESFWSS